MNNANNLDQFYTKPEIAKKFYNYIENNYSLNNYFLFEPSAGKGSFSSLFHTNSLAIDLEPKSIDIIKKDFFDITKIDFNTNLPIFTIGNPPFGKNSSLALKFLNKSSEYSSFIAFVLPKTFKKDSFINKINKQLHLVFEEDLPDFSFEHQEQSYNVPCIFQIWKKEENIREIKKQKKESLIFSFCSANEADFALRRVGVFAGKLFIEHSKYKPASHYYIKINNIYNKEEIIQLFENSFEYFQIAAKNTAGNPSLSKNELIQIVEKNYFKIN